MEFGLYCFIPTVVLLVSHHQVGILVTVPRRWHDVLRSITTRRDTAGGLKTTQRAWRKFWVTGDSSIREVCTQLDCTDTISGDITAYTATHWLTLSRDICRWIAQTIIALYSDRRDDRREGTRSDKNWRKSNVCLMSATDDRLFVYLSASLYTDRFTCHLCSRWPLWHNCRAGS